MQKERTIPLIIAFVLFLSFGLLFYTNMFKSKNDEPKKGVQAREEIILRGANKEAEAESVKEQKDENFTFYKSLKGKSITTSSVENINEKRRSEGKGEKELVSKFSQEISKDLKENIPAGGNFGYSVQMGSFSTFERADEFSKDMSKKGYSPFIISTEYSSKSLFRVRAGHFSSYEEAKKYSLKVNAKENLTSIVVKEKIKDGL